MKSSTLHWLVGIGGVLTAVATGIATKLASDKVNEVRQVRQQQDPSFTDLTKKEKFKIYATYEAIPLTMMVGTCFGVYQCHKESQETIKTALGISTGATTFLNGYRDLTKEAIGTKKEEELYSKAVQKNIDSQQITTSLTCGENEWLCAFKGFGAFDISDGIIFISNSTKVKEAEGNLNNLLHLRADKSTLGDASVTVYDLYKLVGVDMDKLGDSRLMDHTGWSWKADGPVQFQHPISTVIDGNRPVLVFEVVQTPHYIQ